MSRDWAKLQTKLNMSLIGSHISALQTPAFIINERVFEENCRWNNFLTILFMIDTILLRLMLETASSSGVELRGQTKTHKTVEGGIIQTGGTKKKIVTSTLIEVAYIYYLSYVSLSKAESNSVWDVCWCWVWWHPLWVSLHPVPPGAGDRAGGEAGGVPLDGHHHGDVPLPGHQPSSWGQTMVCVPQGNGFKFVACAATGINIAEQINSDMQHQQKWMRFKYPEVVKEGSCSTFYVSLNLILWVSRWTQAMPELGCGGMMRRQWR